MNPDRLREVLRLLNVSQRGLAELLQCDERLVRRWAAGQVEVDAKVSTWLELVGNFLEANPPPTGWQRKSGRLGERD